MNLTPLYNEYLEQLAQQEQMAALLAGAALLVILNVYFLKDRRWLWLAAAGFWASWVGMLIWKVGDAASFWRPVSLGFLMNDPLWYDEAFTWMVARLPIDRLLEATAGDVHPPTWYLIEHVVIRTLGDAPWALRLPSLAFGLVSLWLTYKVGRALGYEHCKALWAVALLFVLPAQLNYMQEARMYALLQAAILTAALGIFSDRIWLMAVGMAAALWTHNLAFVPVGVLAFVALGRAWGDRTRMTATVVYGAVAFCSWVPWLRVMLRQASQVSQGFWVPNYGLGGYLFESARGVLLINQPDSLQIHLYLGFCGLLALICWYCWREARPEALVLLVMMIAPAVVMVLVSEAWRPIFLGRALLPSLPFLALLAVAAIERLPCWSRAPVLGVLIPLLALSLIWPVKFSGNSLVMKDSIDEHAHSGDVVYHANLASYILMSYYNRGVNHVAYPDIGNLSQALTLETQRAMGINRASFDDLLPRRERMLVMWVENAMTTVEEAEELNRVVNLGEAELLDDWEAYDSGLAIISLWEVKYEEPSMQSVR